MATIDVLKRWGVSKIKFIGILGAPEGIENMHSRHPEVPIHLAAVDERLNDNGFILQVWEMREIASSAPVSAILNLSRSIMVVLVLPLR